MNIGQPKLKRPKPLISTSLGSNLRLVREGKVAAPSLSGDGDTMAWIEGNGSNWYDIQLQRNGTTRALVKRVHPDQEITLSHDGNALAFTALKAFAGARGKSKGAVIRNGDYTWLVRSIEPETDTTISDDGNKAVYRTAWPQGNIGVRDFANPEQETITIKRPKKSPDRLQPKIQPDGQSIHWISQPRSEPSSIVCYDLSTRQEHMVGEARHLIHDYDTSNDGAVVAVVEQPSAESKNVDLMLYRSDGASEELAADPQRQEFGPSISRDGKVLVWTEQGAADNNGAELFIKVGAEPPRQLTFTEKGHCFAPQISGDGGTLTWLWSSGDIEKNRIYSLELEKSSKTVPTAGHYNPIRE